MSPQTDYGQTDPVAIAGMHVDSKVGYVESAAAEEVIPFGVLTVEHATDPEIVRLPSPGSVVVTENAGAHTSGGLSATVNGTVVTVAYDTDKATTWGNLATAIAALNFITSCTYSAPTLTTVSQPNIGLFMSVDASSAVGGVAVTTTVGSLVDVVKGFSTKRTSEVGQIRNTNNDRVIMTLSGDTLAASDTVDGVFNGVAIDTVTYATSEANTLQLVANAIKEIPGITAATVSGRTITVTNNPTLLMENASLTVTDNALASVAPAFAAAYSAQAAVLAVTDTAYLAGETVGSERQGKVWCRVEEAVVKGDTVFCRISTGTAATRGAFRNDADSGTAVAITGLRFAGPSQTSSDGTTLIAPIEINYP
jgi:hypothetical protein